MHPPQNPFSWDSHVTGDYVPVHIYHLMSIVAHVCWNPYSLSQCTQYSHLQFAHPLTQCTACYNRMMQSDKSVATYQYSPYVIFLQTIYSTCTYCSHQHPLYLANMHEGWEKTGGCEISTYQCRVRSTTGLCPGEGDIIVL